VGEKGAVCRTAEEGRSGGGGLTESQMFGLLFVGMGLIAFAVLVVLRRRTILLHNHGVATDATVIDVKELKGEAGRFYRTDIDFTDADGQEIDARLRLAHQYRANDRISVVYDPANPKRVDLASAIRPKNPDAGPLALGKLGWTVVLLLVIPGAVLIVGSWGNPI
jgi:hypothetical protein